MSVMRCPYCERSIDEDFNVEHIEDCLRGIAEDNVLAIRGSFDAPGFEACVLAEMEEIRSEQ